MPLVCDAVTEEHHARALSLRDAALDLVRQDGEWHDVENYPGKVRLFDNGRLMVVHRTPFQPIPLNTGALEAGISVLNQRDAARSYGLDIWWHRKKVLSLIWNPNGPLGIIVFKAGDWEHSLFALVAA